MMLHAWILLSALIIGRTAGESFRKAPKFRLPAQFFISMVLVIPLMQRGNAFFLCVIVATGSIADFVLTARGRHFDIRRLASTAVLVLLSVLSVNSPLFDPGISVLTDSILAYLIKPELLQSGAAAGMLGRILILADGWYFVVVEVNFAVTYILKITSIESGTLPPANMGRGKKSSIGMGKMIGFLERTVLYVLIISGNISAIGFVMAAKALARFKELENRVFAEYFIVGTLASVSVTLCLSLAVKFALTL